MRRSSAERLLPLQRRLRSCPVATLPRTELTPSSWLRGTRCVRRESHPSERIWSPNPPIICQYVTSYSVTSKHTFFISTPCFSSACAAGLETSRVMPRILNSLDRVGSARMCLMTEPPWLPVAPKTVMILDIFKIDSACCLLFILENVEYCCEVDGYSELAGLWSLYT
jgi:hypothetical protein